MRSLYSNGKADEALGKAWDAYWRDGRISACRADERGLYRGAIGMFWRDYFRRCTNGEWVLDLATGNGALLHLAADACRDNGPYLICIGTDRARIAFVQNKSDDKQHNVSIHLLGSIANEYLPFRSGQFDKVVSQYGIEYGNRVRTIIEARRVLRPGGEICWLCHWRDGHIARAAQHEAAAARRLSRLELPESLANLARRQIKNGAFIAGSHQKTAASPERKTLDQKLTEAFSLLAREGFGRDSNLSTYLHNLAYIYQHREQYEPALVFEKIHEAGKQLDFHACRLEALYSAALSQEEVNEIKAELQRSGFKIHTARSFIDSTDNQVVGYLINASLEKQ